MWRSLITRETNEEELANIFSKVINSVRDGRASLVDRDGEEIGNIKARFLTHEYRLRKAWRNDEDFEYLWPFVRAHFKKWEEIIQLNYAKDRSVESYYDNFYFSQLINNVSYRRHVMLKTLLSIYGEIAATQS